MKILFHSQSKIEIILIIANNPKYKLATRLIWLLEAT